MNLEISISTAYLFFEISQNALLTLAVMAVLYSVVSGMLRLFRD